MAMNQDQWQVTGTDDKKPELIEYKPKMMHCCKQCQLDLLYRPTCMTVCAGGRPCRDCSGSANDTVYMMVHDREVGRVTLPICGNCDFQIPYAQKLQLLRFHPVPLEYPGGVPAQVVNASCMGGCGRTVPTPVITKLPRDGHQLNSVCLRCARVNNVCQFCENIVEHESDPTIINKNALSGIPGFTPDNTPEEDLKDNYSKFSQRMAYVYAVLRKRHFRQAAPPPPPPPPPVQYAYVVEKPKPKKMVVARDYIIVDENQAGMYQQQPMMQYPQYPPQSMATPPLGMSMGIPPNNNMMMMTNQSFVQQPQVQQPLMQSQQGGQRIVGVVRGAQMMGQGSGQGMMGSGQGGNYMMGSNYNDYMDTY
eukprot:GHVR01155451.1.p1 GENE.GHVR01155451.1~~GHVR01155451.1.p1  ORF type:complete len:364 (-),score=83.75 GHVR01155451.1:415-1506(-)